MEFSFPQNSVSLTNDILIATLANKEDQINRQLVSFAPRPTIDLSKLEWCKFLLPLPVQQNLAV